MRDIILIQILILFITSCISSQNKEMTSEEIWQKYLETIGEKETALSIKTYSDSVVTNTNNGTIISKTKIKFPDKVYNEILYPNNVTVVFIINGDSGIIKSPKGIEKIPTDEIIKYKDQGLILPEFYYKEKGYKIDLIGEEKVNQKKYYNIKVETNSETLNYLIGRSDFSIFRLISNQSYTEVKESIKINGIKLIKSSIYKSGKFKREALRVNTKLNIEINDSIFDLK